MVLVLGLGDTATTVNSANAGMPTHGHRGCGLPLSALTPLQPLELRLSSGQLDAGPSVAGFTAI